METQLLSEAARLSNLYGLGIVLAIIITFAFLWLVWYVLRTTHRREIGLAQIINTNLSHLHQTMLQHDQRSIDAIKSMQEASQYQRDEHREMIRVLQHISAKVEATR